MEKLKASVIIWGNDNYNVLGLLRQLTPFVEKVLFLVNHGTKHCATWSKYCKEYVIAHTYEDGISFLIEKGKLLNNKGFIITTNDTLAEYVDLHRDKLIEYYHLTGTLKSGLLSRMQGKNEMSRLALEIGFNVPWSSLFDKSSSIDKVTCPCVLKPDSQSDKYKCHFKIRYFYKKKDLEEFQKGMGNTERFVIQQLIKREEELLIYGCRMNNGEVVLPGTIIKDRWHHGRIQPGIPQIVNVEQIKAFLEQIEFYGLFSFEFGVMEGKAYFFEVNLRNDGTSLYYYLSGANLPLLWIAGFFNQHNNVPQKVERENYFIDGIGDLPSALGNEITIKKWWSDVKNADIYRHYDSSDWKPFVGTAIKQVPRMILSHFARLIK